ncbi:MAG TPA: hypothetical protein VJY39_12490 [Acidisphaera sp.]|nr:hypothetical protein [Acidisphaera sp.]
MVGGGQRRVADTAWVVEVAADGTMKLPAQAIGALHLEGEREVLVIVGEGRVILTSGRTDDPIAEFEEWEGDADGDAYAKF